MYNRNVCFINNLTDISNNNLQFQCWVRRARSKELQLYVRGNNAEKNPTNHKIMRMLRQVPLLPAHMIKDGLNYVRNYAYSQHKGRPII